jgi:hypothetical protein
LNILECTTVLGHFGLETLINGQRRCLASFGIQKLWNEKSWLKCVPMLSQSWYHQGFSVPTGQFFGSDALSLWQFYRLFISVASLWINNSKIISTKIRYCINTLYNTLVIEYLIYWSRLAGSWWIWAIQLWFI